MLRSLFVARSELLYWKRYGDRIALMMPQLETRTSGDLESRRSRETLYPTRPQGLRGCTRPMGVGAPLPPQVPPQSKRKSLQLLR